MNLRRLSARQVQVGGFANAEKLLRVAGRGFGVLPNVSPALLFRPSPGRGDLVRGQGGSKMVDRDRIVELTQRLQEILSRAERSEEDYEEMKRLNHMIGVALQPVEGEKAELMQASVEAAQKHASQLAKHKKLSDDICLLASAAAGSKARGTTASEFLEFASERIPEAKQSVSVLEKEGLWPWKGVN